MSKSARVPKDSASDLRDEQIGRGTAMATVPVPELIAVVERDIRSRFDALTNDQQRFGYLDTLIKKLEGGVENWTKFYAATAILEEQEPYWSSKGFPTFRLFWRQTAGPLFHSLQELESVFHYAQMACPDFGHVAPNDCSVSSDTAQALGKIYEIGKKPARQIDRKRVFSNVSEAKAYVWDALQWELASNRSFQYRIYRIKRDRPDVAARLLAGEYFRQLPSGLIGIDLVQAECDVFGSIRGHAAGIGSVSRAAHPGVSERSVHPETQIDSELDHVLASAEQSEEIRNHLIDRFKSVTWLVDAFMRDAAAYEPAPNDPSSPPSTR